MRITEPAHEPRPGAALHTGLLSDDSGDRAPVDPDAMAANRPGRSVPSDHGPTRPPVDELPAREFWRQWDRLMQGA